MSDQQKRLEQMKIIDTACDRFEKSLQQKESPRIEDYLTDAGNEIRDQLLEELLKLELSYASTAEGIPQLLTDLKKRFPDDSEVIDKVFSNPAMLGTYIQRPGDDLPSLQGQVSAAVSEIYPRMVGRYRVECEIDKGSFGRVLKAYDDQLDRWVAIKVRLPGAFQSQQETDDFLAEARRVAKLEHPRIVPVYDAGQLEDGSCYIVSKLISGGSLKQVLGNQRMEIDEAAKLIAIVAEAAEDAHQRGFVHRDLKPANILLDEDGEPYICDFGLAIHEDEQLERKGEISGAPAYMSPEQARGESAHLDGRSDIWSLGIIFYELVTGKTPFRGKLMGDLKEAITQQDPKPPRMINPHVPIELEQIILKCLEKDARNRYQTAGDLATAITDWIAQQSNSGVSVPTDATPRMKRLIPFVGVLVGIVFIAIYALSSPEEEVHTPKESDKPITLKAAAGLIQGDIDVRIWNDNSQERTGISIGEPGTLPLQAGDQIRIEAILSEPAYSYVLWISSEGEVSPVYPWAPGDWDSRPENELKSRKISLPQTVDEAWPIAGRSGMESLILLARKTPLPEGIDLKSVIGELSHREMQQVSSVVWFVNGSPVSEKTLPGQLMTEFNRAPQFYNPQKVDDPVLNAQTHLYNQLKPHFELIQAASFANAGVE